MSLYTDDPPHVVIVDDEEDMCELLSLRLEHHGYRVTTFRSGAEALALVEHEAVDAMLLDLRLDGESGLAVMNETHARTSHVPVVILTAHGSIEVAVEAMQRGAHAFLTKPFEDRVLVERIGAAVTSARARRVVQAIDVGASAGPVLLGKSARMRDVTAAIARLARSQATVLLLGESGTGKEVAARTLHVQSRRSGRFVALNCGALPPELIESELFGHRRGAFTGAFRDKEGLFSAARGGTLFLDEIGDAPPAVQVKLLRVLQERTFVPVGATEPCSADVRIVAATNRDLRADVQAGRFREDLFYRIHVVPITMPPLRERLEDVPALAELFAARAQRDHGLGEVHISRAALALLSSHDWPGNVRELANVIEGAALLCAGGMIEREHIAGLLATKARHREQSQRLLAAGNGTPPADALEAIFGTGDDLPSMREARGAFDRAYLSRVLRSAAGNVTAAARIAGRNRTDFYDLLRRYDLNPLQFRRDA